MSHDEETSTQQKHTTNDMVFTRPVPEICDLHLHARHLVVREDPLLCFCQLKTEPGKLH